MERSHPGLARKFDRYGTDGRHVCRTREERATASSAPSGAVVTMSDLEPAYCQAYVQVCEAQAVFEQVTTCLAASLRADEATQITLEQALYECVAARRRVEHVLFSLPGAAFLAISPEVEPVNAVATGGGSLLASAAS